MNTMKYLAYFFNGLYRFLGGTTTVLKIIGIFTSAFLIGIILPGLLPLSVAGAMLIGLVTVAYDAYQVSKMRKNMKTLSKEIQVLEKEILKYRAEKENKKRQYHHIDEQLKKMTKVQNGLTHAIKRFETLQDLFYEKFSTINKEKLPQYASKLYGIIGKELTALTNNIDNDKIEPEQRLTQLNDLIDSLEAQVKSSNTQLNEKTITNKKWQTIHKSVTPQKNITDSKAANHKKPSFFKKYKTALGVAVKTTLMSFALGFGISTLAVAMFVASPIVIASTMTATVVGFSLGLFAASTGLGLTTAYFHHNYISPEEKNFHHLILQKNKLLQEKQALIKSSSRYDKNIKKVNAHLYSATLAVKGLFSQARQCFARFNKKLSARAKPKALSATQALEVVKLAHQCPKKQNEAIEKLNHQQLDQTALLTLFEALPPAKQAILLAKWENDMQFVEKVSPTPHP